MTKKRKHATARDIARIRESIARVSPGPWSWDGLTVFDREGRTIGECSGDHDAEFLIQARADVIGLLDEVDRLNSVNRSLREDLARSRGSEFRSLDKAIAEIERLRGVIRERNKKIAAFECGLIRGA